MFSSHFGGNNSFCSQKSGLPTQQDSGSLNFVTINDKIRSFVHGRIQGSGEITACRAQDYN